MSTAASRGLRADMRSVSLASAGDQDGPDRAVGVACALVADTTNGISSVKIMRVALDDVLARVLGAAAAPAGVRLVLRPVAGTSEADLVIEQAIPPIHFAAQPPPTWRGLLTHLLTGRRRQAVQPHATAPSDATTSTMRNL